MKDHIEKIKKIRIFLLGLLQELSEEELNLIPLGFNNNIIWNVAHLIAAQQGLCYARAGAPMKVDESFFIAYKTGSKPEKHVTNTEIENIKHLLLSTLDQLEADLQNNLLDNYESWTTRYAVSLTSIQEAVEFVLFHEGLHMGYIMALKRIIKTPQPIKK